MTNYNDGSWHVWNGGECPVHEKSRVDITYADGITRRQVLAGNYTWEDPLMFRVVKEHKEPREFWIFVNGHGDLCVTQKWRDGAIHVREVIE